MCKRCSPSHTFTSILSQVNANEKDAACVSSVVHIPEGKGIKTKKQNRKGQKKLKKTKKNKQTGTRSRKLDRTGKSSFTARYADLKISGGGGNKTKQNKECGSSISARNLKPALFGK